MTDKNKEMMKNAIKVYFILGSTNCKNNETAISVLNKAIAGGITCFQFREKGERCSNRKR